MPKNDGDWIKLHRSMLRSPIFQNSALFHLWSYCLLEANWRPSKWLIPGTVTEIKIDRGQFVTGRDALHKALYPKTDSHGKPIRREYTPSSKTLWRYLHALAAMDCLTLETVANRCTLVTIVNYSTYQGVKTARVPHVSRTCPEPVPHLSTLEEGEEGEERKKKTFARPTLEDVAQYCLERHNGIDPQAWMDHYQSNGWVIGRNRTPMQDWKAAVRTWEAKRREDRKADNGHSKILPVGSPEYQQWKP